jgi:hypothetical protein
MTRRLTTSAITKGPTQQGKEPCKSCSPTSQIQPGTQPIRPTTASSGAAAAKHPAAAAWWRTAPAAAEPGPADAEPEALASLWSSTTAGGAQPAATADPPAQQASPTVPSQKSLPLYFALDRFLLRLELPVSSDLSSRRVMHRTPRSPQKLNLGVLA